MVIDLALLVLLILSAWGLLQSDGWVLLPLIWMFATILVLRRAR
jgi:hypothetical protein